MTDKETTRDKMTECYDCKHKRDVPGNCHIRCANPDPNMQGHQYGIHHGWFCYPILFDPTWKEFECANFEEKDFEPIQMPTMQSTAVYARPAVDDGGVDDTRSDAQKIAHNDERMRGTIKTKKVVIPDVVFDQIKETVDEALDETDAKQAVLGKGRISYEQANTKTSTTTTLNSVPLHSTTPFTQASKAEQLELEVGKESK